MYVRNLDEAEGYEIPGVGFVEPGGTIEVPDDVGKSLCDQDRWEKSTAKAAKAADEGDE